MGVLRFVAFPSSLAISRLFAGGFSASFWFWVTFVPTIACQISFKKSYKFKSEIPSSIIMIDLSRIRVKPRYWKYMDHEEMSTERTPPFFLFLDKGRAGIV